jgi:GT2 family glycosyltransferase
METVGRAPREHASKMGTCAEPPSEGGAQELPMWPRVAIIVLNWNRCEDTLECLGSLRQLRYPTYQTIVVDNGSTDGSADRITVWAKNNAVDGPEVMTYQSHTTSPPCLPCSGGDAEAGRMRTRMSRGARSRSTSMLTIIRAEQNLGFAGGNNVGIRYALGLNCEYVLILNNDTVVRSDALVEMVRRVAGKPEIGMVAPAVYDYARKDVVDRMGLALTKAGLAYERQSENDGVLFCPSGCAALYSRPLLRAVECGGQYFDEDFFAYYEDIDLGFRAQRKGFRAVLADEAIIYHKGGAASGGRGSRLSNYLGHRNAIWSVVKNYPAGMLFTESPWIILGNVLGVLGSVGRPEFGSVVKGKWHGLVGVADAWRKRRGEDMPAQDNVNLPIDRRRFPFRRGHWR